MSIEEKIAQLMEEAKKLETVIDEEKQEEVTEDKKQEEVVSEVTEEKINIGSLFEGEEFSEEFKAKAAELFEAAVSARVKQEVAHIQEGLEQQSLTEAEELKEGLIDKVDGYLDYVVEQWMQKNELALERGIKSEILESFVVGMKGLFEEHYIDMPEAKVDLAEELQLKAESLEQELAEAAAQNAEFKRQLSDIAKEKQIQEAAKGLSELETERFKKLAEELAYDNEESFAKKLEMVIESFVKAPKAKPIVESVVTDAPVEVKEETQIDPQMARYLRALEG